MPRTLRPAPTAALAGLMVGTALCCGIAAQAPAPAQAPPPPRFPAQLRPAEDPELVARGRRVFDISCRGCHGADLRGGDMGGPNLLRSQAALNDQHGELLSPIVQGSRPAMPAVPLQPDDVTAVAAFIHSVLAQGRAQGAPPVAASAPLNIPVGDASAGRAYFGAKCGACHSASGDLQGIAGRVTDPTQLQNVWVASRNGYFYTLDRVSGEHLLTSKYGTATNWAKGMRPNGVVEPDPGKAATIPGSLVSPVEFGVTNWQPAAFSSKTGLFYVHERNGFNLLYLSDPDPRGSMGLGGKTVAPIGSAPSFLTAIDYRSGKVAWRHRFPGVTGAGGAGGVLATAGDLVFTGDAGGNFVAFDASNGAPVWHTRIGTITNAPETYLVDGRQHVLVAVGDSVYAFALYQ